MARKARSRFCACGLGMLLLGLGLGASAGRAADRELEIPREKVFQNTARSFVIVRYHLKKSERPPLDGSSGYGSEQRRVLSYILNKNVLEVIGVIISDKGEVFTPEGWVQLPDVVAKITVAGWDGQVVPAQADRLLTKASGRVLRIRGELPATWKALAFTKPEAVTPETTFWAATPRPAEQHRIQVGSCTHNLDWTSAMDPNHSLLVSGFLQVGVLCNAAGQPVGVTAVREIDLGPDGPIWQGEDVLADAGISADEQRQLEEKLETDFAEGIYEITITFRPEPEEEEPFSYGGRFGYRGRSSRRDGQERLVYGLGFARDRLLVPEVLSSEQIVGIDTISVQAGDQEIPARFGGVLKQCGAMVIELEEGDLPRTAEFSTEGTLARTTPFWGGYVHELAGKDVRVQYTRWLSKKQGYADQWYPVTTQSIRSGSWLLDRQGRLVGLCCRARYEQDRLKPYLLAERYNRYGGSDYFSSSSLSRSMGYEPHRYSSDRRLFEAGELVQMLADAPASYDKHMRHLTKDEQKRRVWLGVEYTAPNKEMVKQMNLREPTRDGRIGLMVNRVYPGSPAAELGLTEGDILLTLAVPGTPWPIELAADEREDFDMPDFDEADIPKEFEAMGLRMPRRRPWPSRENTLTRMLADIGEGTTVTLSHIHDGQIVDKQFTIEQSPRDMLSAAKYKHEKLGLTVKDLTYEVRTAMRLDESAMAVVVTDVEQGTPAALARVNRYELIRAVDGQPVENVQTLEQLVAAAQQAEKESVRLTVEWMGKTRLADLKFEAKGSPNSLLKSLLPGLQ